MKDNNYSVYKHTSPSGKVYIGISKNKPEHRWNNGRGYTKNYHFRAAIEKYGWDNFEHEILYKKLSKEDACSKEIELIKLYDSTNRKRGYNISHGGTAPPPLTETTRKKISENTKKQWLNEEYRKKMISVNTGNKYWLGRTHSETHKAYMSEIMKGRVITEEARKKISESKKGKGLGETNAFYGRHHSEETKRKQSELKSKEVILLNTKQRFKNAKIASKIIGGGCHETNLRKCCNGLSLSCGSDGITNERYSWMYYEDYLKLDESSINERIKQAQSINSNDYKQSLGKKLKPLPGGTNPMAKKCVCINTSEVFDCIKDAGKIYGSYTSIGKCCRGKQKTAGKHPVTGEPLKWMYYED